MRLSFSVLIPVILCLENRKIRMIFCFTRKAFLRNTPVPRTPASITHSLACDKEMSKVLVHPHKKAAAGCTHTLPCLCAWAGAGTDGKAGSFRSEGQNVLQAQQVWEVTPSWQGFDSSSDDIQPVVFSRRQPDETPECDSGARLRKWSQNKKKKSNEVDREQAAPKTSTSPLVQLFTHNTTVNSAFHAAFKNKRLPF